MYTDRWLRAALMLALAALTVGSPCDSNERLSNPEGCIEALRLALADKTRFWFGEDYPILRPEAMRSTVECHTTLPAPGYGFSIVDIVFAGNLDTSNMREFLSITYNNAGGEYTACDHKYEVGPSMFEVYPLSEDLYRPFETRSIPQLNWGADPNKRYTLVIKDVAMGSIHGLYINIPGEAVDEGEAVVSYRGPLAVRMFSSPVLFVVYEQADGVLLVLLPSWSDAATDPAIPFDIPYFASAFQLGGPYAVNWVNVAADAYSTQHQRDKNVVDNCAIYVTEALLKKNVSFAKPQSLGVFMSMHMTPKLLTFEYCCQEHTIDEPPFVLDPIGDLLVDAAEVRTDGVDIQITLGRNGSGSLEDFEGRYFTVLCVDISVPFATAGTRDRPLLHWMSINRQVDLTTGVLAAGTDLQTYRGPGPPDDKPHEYYFLLYQQTAILNINSSEAYSGDCSSRLTGRCLYDVATFASANDLDLVGASWMLSENNDYVNFARGTPQKDKCAGRSGYADPCPVYIASAPPRYNINLWTISLNIVSLLISFICFH